MIRIKVALRHLVSSGAMISIEDCLAMCGLSADEVAAIAEHEHVPEIAAATLGRYLLVCAHGSEQIRDMLADDIRVALRAGDTAHAGALMSALRHFLETHPEVRTKS